jgi:hypothetical protein
VRHPCNRLQLSAQPELVGDGWCVEVQPQWNPAQLGWFCTPMVRSIVEALEAAYDQGGVIRSRLRTLRWGMRLTVCSRSGGCR